MYQITTRTLRFYEAEGMIAPRREGLRRFYCARDRVRLDVILKGKRLGFSLAELRQLLGRHPHMESANLLTGVGSVELAARLTALEARRGELQRSIEELRQQL